MRSPRSAKKFKIASSLSVKRSRQPAEWSIMGLGRISMRRRRMASSARFSGRLWPREPPMRIFEKLLEAAGELSPDDRSGGAQMLRMQTITYHDRYTAHNKRMHLRWAWDAFFHDYDALIAPIMATPAFEHDHSDMGKRKITIDGEERPYWEQLFGRHGRLQLSAVYSYPDRSE